MSRGQWLTWRTVRPSGEAQDHRVYVSAAALKLASTRGSRIYVSWVPFGREAALVATFTPAFDVHYDGPIDASGVEVWIDLALRAQVVPIIVKRSVWRQRLIAMSSFGE